MKACLIKPACSGQVLNTSKNEDLSASLDKLFKCFTTHFLLRSNWNFLFFKLWCLLSYHCIPPRRASSLYLSIRCFENSNKISLYSCFLKTKQTYFSRALLDACCLIPLNIVVTSIDLVPVCRCLSCPGWTVTFQSLV